MQDTTYEETWGTPVGQDCIDLCSTLPRWLGERLTFLGNHTSGVPAAFVEEHGGVDLDNVEAARQIYTDTLRQHGAALTRLGNLSRDTAEELTDEQLDQAFRDGQEALRWVATNLQSLWD